MNRPIWRRLLKRSEECHESTALRSPAPTELGFAFKSRPRQSGAARRTPNGLSPFALAMVMVGWFVTAASAEPASAQIEEPAITDRDRSHWSFQPLKRPSLPVVKNGSLVQNAIDLFVLERLESEDLKLAPQADRPTLIRRLSFDLTGLPPTPGEVKAFVEDSSPGFYESLVDRVLSSPAYGERWAQHWLDLARYAETDGFEHDHVRTNAWRYRDWVVRAFNRDLPYNEFVSLQLAGDEIEPDNPDAAVATGFLLSGPDMPDINLAEERRHTVLNEMTSTVGVAFLGLGVGCAQCHDHKFDPVSQADFYRLRAFFENTVFPKRDKQLGHRIKEPGSTAPVSYLRIRGDFRRQGPVVEPDFPRIVKYWDQNIPPPSAGAESTGRRQSLARWLTRPDHPLALRVIANRLWQHHFGRPLVGTPNDFGLLGETPTHPELLDWLASELPRQRWSLKSMHRLLVTSATYRQASRGSGTAWERALTVDRENRLLSRMNRKRLSGEAVRDLMLAASGQLNLEIGGPGVRPPLPDEVMSTLLRKTHWVVSENQKDHFRRSVYLFVRRNLRYPMFDVFDRPDANASCARRNVSTTATQSLTLLNSEFTHAAARELATTLIDTMEARPPDWVTQGYRRVLGRAPSGDELRLGVAFLEDQQRQLAEQLNDSIKPDRSSDLAKSVDPIAAAALTDFCMALFNLNELIYVD